jgi:hypothetical protein
MAVNNIHRIVDVERHRRDRVAGTVEIDHHARDMLRVSAKAYRRSRGISCSRSQPNSFILPSDVLGKVPAECRASERMAPASSRLR